MRTLLALPLLALTACSGGELVGVHIQLKKDGSGLVTTRALVEPPAPAAAEARSQAVTWTSRASLLCSQGTFTAIGDLSLGNGGIRFTADLGDARPSLRVRLQRGANAEWIGTLVPGEKARRDMAKVYDPTARTTEIGDTIRIEVALPGEVFASGVRPTGGGVEAAHEGKRAYLLIPVRTALEAGAEFEWSINW